MGPIFIVGAPRSGTSLLRVMLNRHPAIALCDETYFFYYIYARRRAFGDLSLEKNRRYLIKRSLATERIRRLGLNREALAATLLSEGTTYPNLFASLLRFYAAQKGKKRFGEKTPQHALAAETICDFYPDCKILHIIRDPRDVVVSLMSMPWGSRSVRVNARTWLACHLGALRVANRPNYLAVSYEQLVADPESELRRICAFIGEEYTPAMLAAHDVRTMDKWWFQRAQDAVQQGRVELWRRELTPRQLQIVEWVVSAHLESCGYQRATTGCPGAIKATAMGEQALYLLFERLRRFPRYFYYWLRPTRLGAEESWLDRPLSGWALGRFQREADDVMLPALRTPSPPPAPRSPST